jgi:hypothetical protein
MIYDPALQTKIIREFFERERQIEQQRCDSSSTVRPLRYEAGKDLAILATPLKGPEHKGENEWRILIIQRDDGKPLFTPLTREDGVCYFELPLIVPEIVTEVVCGPHCVTDTAGLRSQLATAGLSRVRRCQSLAQSASGQQVPVCAVLTKPKSR